jgi:Glucosamine-6-phosphate isomerases/6-phosphogluconolactonase
VIDMQENHVRETATYGTLTVVEDAEVLACTLADHFVAWAIEKMGPVRVALSGGSTPRRTYQEPVSPRLFDRVPWPRIHWYWGAERFVPRDDPDSNFRMGRDAMLAAAPSRRRNLGHSTTSCLLQIERRPARDSRNAESRRRRGCHGIYVESQSRAATPLGNLISALLACNMPTASACFHPEALLRSSADRRRKVRVLRPVVRAWTRVRRGILSRLGCGREVGTTPRAGADPGDTTE